MGEMKVLVLDLDQHIWNESADDFSQIKKGNIFCTETDGVRSLVLVASEDAAVTRLDDKTGREIYRVKVEPVRVFL